MTAPQKTAPERAKATARQVANGEEMSVADLVNLRLCLVYSTSSLEGLDPKRFTQAAVTRAIDDAFRQDGSYCDIPEAGAAVA
jgi:hypothetical protein